MVSEILSASDRANWQASNARPSGKTQKGKIPMKGKKSGKTSCHLPTDEQIKQRAYELFLARGATHGHDVEDWLRAQAELREAANGTDAASERPGDAPQPRPLFTTHRKSFPPLNTKRIDPRNP